MNTPTPSSLRAQALRELGPHTLRDVVDCAHRVLRAKGPRKHPNASVEHALEAAIAALEQHPSRDEALRLFARAIAAEIVLGAMPTDRGCDRLAVLARSAPLALDPHPWIELQDELSLAEGGTLDRNRVYDRIIDTARALLDR
jgi:hypothetical protein